MNISNTEMSYVFISSHSDGKELLVQGTNKAKGFQSKRKGVSDGTCDHGLRDFFVNTKDPKYHF